MESSSAASTLSEPSLEPSSTTMICSSTGSSTERMRRITSATVVRSLNTGTITESVRYVRGGGARSGRRRSSGLLFDLEREVLDRALDPLAQTRSSAPTRAPSGPA